MKKTILLLTIIITCVSCRYEERGNLTKTGKEMYDTWQAGTGLVMDNVVRAVFLVNAWEASDSAGRIAIEDQYFPEYKIRKYGENMFRIMDGARPIITIETEGHNSLAEAGTTWHITDKIEYVQTWAYVTEAIPYFARNSGIKKLTITNLGGNRFSVENDTLTYSGSRMRWELTFSASEMPTDIYATAFEMSGNGCFNLPADRNNEYNFEERKAVLLSYDIAQPLTHYASEALYWDGGALRLTATTEGKEEVTTAAEILDRNTIEITYKGITEQW